MRNLFTIVLLITAPFFCFAQNQQGYIYVQDLVDGVEVYYVSPFLECSFAGDHDGIDAKRNSLDEQYKTYIEENYDLVEFQTVYSNWMEPGRGVYPAKTYENALENLPIMREGCKVIVVEGFVVDCLD